MLKSVSPFLQVTDLSSAQSFYSSLGFELQWAYPDEDPTHMAMSMHDVELSFVLVDHANSKADLYIHVEGVELYHRAFSEKVKDVSPIIQSAYGMKDFSLEDPWGHHLVFGESSVEDTGGSSLQPKVSDTVYVFVTTKDKIRHLENAVLIFQESEGTTLILPMQEAEKLGYQYEETWAHISLGIESALDMVGLTAIFSNALAKENIPCNVVAAFYHDHIFVPYELKDRASGILTSLKL